MADAHAPQNMQLTPRFTFRSNRPIRSAVRIRSQPLPESLSATFGRFSGNSPEHDSLTASALRCRRRLGHAWSQQLRAITRDQIHVF